MANYINKEKPTGSKRFGGLGIHKDQHSVSWKLFSKDARANFRFWAANNNAVEIEASESYESEKGKFMNREVMMSFDREEAQAVVDYLNNWLESTK